MSLIKTILEEVVNTDKDLSSILLECKMLSAHLNNKLFDDWINWETNGYPDEIEVPDYRIWDYQIKGNFFGSFGSQIKDAPIPILTIPKNYRENFQRFEYRKSIAGAENILKNKKGTIRIGLEQLPLILGTNVYEGYNCIQAWGEISASNLFELINAVRSRLIDFLNALKKEGVSIVETEEVNEPNIEQNRIKQIFNTTVYEGSANIVGNAYNSTINFEISPGNFSQLKDFLQKNGIKEEDIEVLEEAIQNEEKPKTKNKFGPKVSKWISKMIEKSAQGIWQISLTTAGSLLAEAISRYYGL